ncbi:hypothetical protein L1987_24212 [Smallanthus sonchifolius]|uniref:Uncharacterized protein n=1 Tax=Smallanthus sonchifolius TaxID=185202 RepID=A0ACB9IL53_9ASTR|nr:hypothetical protein L1987_24212 [Smallanthus sonchifolius]
MRVSHLKRAVDRSIDEEQWGLVGWAQDFLRGGKLKEIIDPYLKGRVSLKCLNDYAKLVDGCLHTRLKLRITMAEVVFGLESILALHERSDNSFPETGIITFGRKLQKYFDTYQQEAITDPLVRILWTEDSFKLVAFNLVTCFISSHNSNNNSGMPNPWHSNPPSHLIGELTAVGWPSWLAAVSGEALKGWLPHRDDTFKNLGKAKGSYSVVYKARDIPTGNVVALKKIKCDTSDPESENDGYGDYMHFTEPQVKHYMHQLFSGLKYCHDHQVLHRDLKGSDLLVSNNGVLKIADFGSASFFGLIHEQSMTNFVATYWYPAPELLLGATEYGGVDLWSVGCILVGLLAKRTILSGRTEAEQLHKIYSYWKTYILPLETLYKPQLQFRRCLTETFKDFPSSALSLLAVLLSVDPAKRQNATSALKSKVSFFFLSSNITSISHSCTTSLFCVHTIFFHDLNVVTLVKVINVNASFLVRCLKQMRAKALTWNAKVLRQAILLPRGSENKKIILRGQLYGIVSLSSSAMVVRKNVDVMVMHRLSEPLC